MTTQQIKRNLEKAFSDYVNTIDDEEIKLLIRKNAIITGGAIASMLLNEKVNDYDIYFKSKGDALKIANYYITKFKKLVSSKVKAGNEVVTKALDIACGIQDNGIKIKVPSSGIVKLDSFEKYEYFEGVPDQENRETKISEFLSVDEFVVAENKQTDSKYIPLCITQNAISLSDKIQLIFRFTGTPPEIHRNFDFVHATNYWHAESGNLTLLKDALESLLTKRLKYNGSLYPIATLFRIRKFIERGFTIHAGEMIKIAFQINELDLNNFGVLQDQLIGVDMAYMQELIEALKAAFDKDKEFKVTASYICELVDKIFE